MECFNIFGLALISLIMIPNIIFALRHKDRFENQYTNKTIDVLENIGRCGCIAFMIFNIPGTWFGWWSDEAFAVYLVGNALLCTLYCVLWIVCWKKHNYFRALALSAIPSIIFLFSGTMCRSVLLIFSALLFAPVHIFISCKSAVQENSKKPFNE